MTTQRVVRVVCVKRTWQISEADLRIEAGSPVFTTLRLANAKRTKSESLNWVRRTYRGRTTGVWSRLIDGSWIIALRD